MITLCSSFGVVLPHLVVLSRRVVMTTLRSHAREYAAGMDLLPTIVLIIMLIIAGIVGLTTRNWLLVLILAGIALLGTQNWLLPIPLLIITGVLALTIRNTRAAMRDTTPTGRFAGFRMGLAAVPLYLVAVGVGHLALAIVWYDRTTGLARDGQAFSGTMVLGIGFILLGLVAAPFAIPAERDFGGLVRGALGALGVAAAVVAYTASRGYLVGGTPGELHCIVEQGRELCPPGDGTWIMDARPDVFLMLMAVIGAYALSHIVTRLSHRGASRPAMTATP